MTRRQRLMWITAAGGLLFLGAATIAAVRWQQHGPAYRPGEDLDGITSKLARTLPDDHPSVVLTDATQAAGINFQHFSGTRSSQLPEDMGSGAAWGDYDSDGFADLVVANEAGPLTQSEAERRASPARLTLYHNNGDGTFTDATDRSGLDFRGLGMAVAWGDFDNDGKIDLALTSYDRTYLFHNKGSGRFEDQTERSGIAAPRGFWAGASWGDYDRDGYLDLYITGYVKYHPTQPGASASYDVESPASINPSSFEPERNLLFHNRRDGTFAEVARSAGVTDTTGRGLAASWADFDDDGWPDLYVANDQSDNAFFRNLGNGKFEDVSHSARVADYRSAMGIAVGDWDGDGTQDIFLTHWIAQENALYSNQLKRFPTRTKEGKVRLTFMDEADRYGLGQISLDFVGWATSFIDYDNDGTLDLFVVNGSTFQKRSDPTQLVPMRNQLFWGRGRSQGFYDVSGVAGSALARELVGRGGAFADYDNDGDVDAFIVNHGGPGVLLRNDGGNRNHWLQVEVRGTRNNRQGIGATVRVVTGGKTQVRQIGAQASYLSQNSLIETFGLDSVTQADTLEVIWPGGSRIVRAAVPADQRLLIEEGRGGDVSRARVQEFWQLYRAATTNRTARRTAKAADAYAQALEINPDHEDALYHLGAMRLELGDYGGARTAWRHLIAVNESSARGHSQLGALHMCPDDGAPFQLDTADTHLRRAHEINKEENGPLLRLGESALLRGDRKTAASYFEKVLATHAENAVAHFHSGYLAWKVGDLATARSHFLKSASAAPRPAPGPGEGDTKKGGAVLAARDRCGQLRSPIERPRSADPESDLIQSYRTVDSLVESLRNRAPQR